MAKKNKIAKRAENITLRTSIDRAGALVLTDEDSGEELEARGEISLEIAEGSASKSVTVTINQLPAEEGYSLSVYGTGPNEPASKLEDLTPWKRADGDFKRSIYLLRPKDQASIRFIVFAFPTDSTRSILTFDPTASGNKI